MKGCSIGQSIRLENGNKYITYSPDVFPILKKFCSYKQDKQYFFLRL